jgi:hypothetical protein
MQGQICYTVFSVVNGFRGGRCVADQTARQSVTAKDPQRHKPTDTQGI